MAGWTLAVVENGGGAGCMLFDSPSGDGSRDMGIGMLACSCVTRLCKAPEGIGFLADGEDQEQDGGTVSRYKCRAEATVVSELHATMNLMSYIQKG